MFILVMKNHKACILALVHSFTITTTPHPYKQHNGKTILLLKKRAIVPKATI